jgi:hypothetical protein
MRRFFGVCWLGFALALGNAWATPGDDLLISELTHDLRNSAKVPTSPLVTVTQQAIGARRDIAADITGAAVRRAEDCSATEAVVKAALQALAPTPTALEVYSIVREAVRYAPRSEETSVNANGDKVAAGSCTEAILATAASVYPQFATVLNDSGKQLDGKTEAFDVPGQEETAPGTTAPSAVNLPLPPALIAPGGGGLVSVVTPTS